MNDQNSHENSGQGGVDQETERRNRENETGQQSQQPPQAGQQSQQQPQAGQQQQSEFGQQSETLTSQDQGGQSQGGQPETGQSQDGQSQGGQSGGESGSGFVGSGSDQSSDYLTKGENQDFQPEGQGASESDDTNIESSQSGEFDATLDDGSDTSR